jgi:16S rRNA (adenine1518-N6/adenine1519-N6)-dimethyltransferase
MIEKLTSPRVVRDTLARLGAAPSKALGQNFLIDAHMVDILVQSAEVTPDDTVLEIGPGLGVLTDALAEKAGRVVAVEKDRRFTDHLKERFADHPKVTIIGGDFLELDLPALLAEHNIGKVVANLPYNTGTRMLVDLIRAPKPPRTLVVTVQLEVGERLMAGAGDEAYGMLSVWAGVEYQVELRKKISPTCFYPPPTVWSVITRLTARHPDGQGKPLPLFYALTKAAFQHRRKQLAGVLDKAPPPLRVPPAMSVPWLVELGVDPKARPEQLSVDQWLALTSRLADFKAKQGDGACI